MSDPKHQREICYSLNQMKDFGLKTEAEKGTEAAVISAKSALKSAEASLESARTARSDRNILYYALIFAAIVAVVSALSFYAQLTTP